MGKTNLKPIMGIHIDYSNHLYDVYESKSPSFSPPAPRHFYRTLALGPSVFHHPNAPIILPDSQRFEIHLHYVCMFCVILNDVGSTI